MPRRRVILALAAVLVLSIVVPAVGGGGDWFGLAKRADRSSEQAIKKARRAIDAARTASGQARRANRRVTTLKTQIETLDDRLNDLGVRFASARGTVSTASDSSYEALPGGPQTTVQVLPSGLIEVWAQVTMAGDGAVSLFEDGQQLPGQAQLCASAPGALLALGPGSPDPATVGTPPAIGVAGCGTDGPPGPVLFRTTPGVHTYELRYADNCSCTPVQFSQRKLYVVPRPGFDPSR